MVQETTPLAYSQIFWGENCSLLLLARILHQHADPSSNRWGSWFNFEDISFGFITVGTICFLYGLFTLNSSENIPSKDICDPDRLGQTILCPLCDNACSYLKLSDSCFYSKISHVFDNSSTVFFAIFMSCWGRLWNLLKNNFYIRVFITVFITVP